MNHITTPMSRARITIREYIVRRTNLCRGVVVLWMIGMLTVAGMYPSYWHAVTPAAVGGSLPRSLLWWQSSDLPSGVPGALDAEAAFTERPSSLRGQSSGERRMTDVRAAG